MPKLPGTDLPIVQSPMAGGATTPELVAAVADAGALGFVAAGYLSAEQLRDRITAVRERTRAPFGVNLFVPWPDRADSRAVDAYAERLAPDAERLDVALGKPRWDDDDWAAKVELLLADPLPVVGLTFGCPTDGTIAALQNAGSAVAVTVTTRTEAADAVAAGADALLLQGAEAGAHRGSWTPDAEPVPLATLLAEVRPLTDVPLVAAGGLADVDAVRRILAAGATYAQVGTALLRSPESGAPPLHKEALVTRTGTTITRAFTGRRARGLVNGFIRDHGPDEVEAYPQVHHVTRPLRAAAAKAGDPERMALWAGTGHASAQDAPAAEIIRALTP
ncbi:nitronate monooxygenase [Cryptosporangium aurantiacum]|uniref:nitronate monooxygenase n=1 Tax=Cryptosporangium aurantiacum TaxID=134849 RepID=UPI001C49DB05|nr:nitronate monooxygenase [Cryptosporangium aurantiacum]